MTAPIERRLAKLEDTLLPKPLHLCCMLSEPATDAPPQAWAE